MSAQIALPADQPPSYPAHELSNLSSPPSHYSRSSISSSLPPYQEEGPTTQLGDGVYPNFSVPTPFAPTQKLRIDAEGLGVIRLPVAPRPDPIPVYDVTSDDVLRAVGAAAGNIEGTEPLYVSLRDARCSGTCRLVRGYDQSEALCTTTYRWGPGKPPVITLHAGPHGKPATDHPLGDKDDVADTEDIESTFTLRSVGTFTRAQILRTHLGTFRWSYLSSKKRKGQDGDSILVLEKLTTISKSYPGSSSKSKTEEVTTEIARFVRGPGTRTPGSGKSTAGNGGLLLMDLGDWRGEKGTEEEEMRVLIVASCIGMLKKEVDRRRAAQMAVAISILTGP